MQLWTAFVLLGFSLSSFGAKYHLVNKFSDDATAGSVEITFDSEGKDEVTVTTPNGIVQRLLPGKMVLVGLDSPSPHRESLEAFRERHHLFFEINQMEVKGNSGTIICMQVGIEFKTYLILAFGAIVEIPRITRRGNVSWGWQSYHQDAYFAVSFSDGEGDKGALYIVRFSDGFSKLVDPHFHDLHDQPISSDEEIAAMGGLLTVPSLNYTFDLNQFHKMPSGFGADRATPYPPEFSLSLAYSEIATLPILQMGRDHRQLDFTLPKLFQEKLLPGRGLVASERLADIKRVLEKEYANEFYWVRIPSFSDHTYGKSDQYILLPRKESGFNPLNVRVLDSRPLLSLEPWNPIGEQWALLVTGPSLTPAHLLSMPDLHPKCGTAIALRSAG